MSTNATDDREIGSYSPKSLSEMFHNQKTVVLSGNVWSWSRLWSWF